jgi:hypothetical protein
LSLERRHPWLLPVRIWQSVPDVGEEAIEQVVLVGLEEPVCRPVMTLMMSPADVHYGNARRLTDTGDGARIAPETRSVASMNASIPARRNDLASCLLACSSSSSSPTSSGEA